MPDDTVGKDTPEGLGRPRKAALLKRKLRLSRQGNVHGYCLIGRTVHLLENVGVGPAYPGVYLKEPDPVLLPVPVVLNVETGVLVANGVHNAGLLNVSVEGIALQGALPAPDKPLRHARVRRNPRNLLRQVNLTENVPEGTGNQADLRSAPPTIIAVSHGPDNGNWQGGLTTRPDRQVLI